MLGIANALVIVGGLLPLALARDEILEAWENDAPLIQSSKALRGVGQGIFLAITIFVVAALSSDAFTRSKSASSRLRTEITILLAACPFIVVRGAFGLAQAVESMINVSLATFGAPTSAPFADSRNRLRRCVVCGALHLQRRIWR